jgi:dTDP-4-dehydrorhamnose 3,5-epimerase
MKFEETPLKGAYLINIEKKGDERGFFARSFCQKEFNNIGLLSEFVQVNNSLTQSKGTIRGMHYQLNPSAEVKLVRCIRGALYDVILDLRPDSSSFGKWFGRELSAKNRQMMYVPRGFSHGFITLEDNTETFYFASEFYSPNNERGIRYNDPRFGIDWPIEPTELSKKDENFPDFDPDWHGISSLTGFV